MFLTQIDEVIQLEGGHRTAGQLIQRLNPKLRGWALYHRHAASKPTFAHVDQVIFSKLGHWARRRHRRKSAAWVNAHYFTRLGDNRGTFRGRVTDDAGGRQTVRLVRAESTHLHRHVKVRGNANP